MYYTRRRSLCQILLTPLLFRPALGAASERHDLLHYLDATGNRRPVRSRADWRRRRSQILERFQLVSGPLPRQSGRPKFSLDAAAREAAYTRHHLLYEPEPGDSVPAWLLVPHNIRGRVPAVLCLHQTTRIGKDEPAGLGGKPNLHYAKELAERGYVALAPDYPNFGEYKIDVYARGYASATMKGIFNHMRAVDVLESLPYVDRRRIGVCGHSLGGHNALFVAAFEERIQVAVTSCGFTAMPKYSHGNLTGWSHKGYMPRIAEAYEKSPEKLPWDFPEILGAIAPRAIFVNAPTRDSNFDLSGVEDCIAAALPLYTQVFHAADRLVAEYPEAEHDFPPETRRRAYDFIAGRLGRIAKS